ncbi:MAG TPA: DUF2293 domain-containing protein [Polyangiales bacterium]|nr:DUF2293 domain-containing protein [Polyangiales bacterium]
MTERTRQVSPTRSNGMVRDETGALLPVPKGWVLLPPGDAALTRRVKAGGPVWTMQEKKGRKTFSLGMYAPADRIAQLRAALENEREDPAYTRKLEQGRQRRARAEANYAVEFQAEVLAFLDFAPRYKTLADAMAKAIAAHATPVGSGTVARTQRIAVDRRAEAATIAWLRHATTAYDSMQIARVRGLRREVRRSLAQQSRALLERYRRGEQISEDSCPLRRALK